MTVTPFDHPFLSGLLGDPEIALHFSAHSDLTAMIAFELALAQAEADEGLISKDAADAIAAAREMRHRPRDPHQARWHRRRNGTY